MFKSEKRISFDTNEELNEILFEEERQKQPQSRQTGLSRLDGLVLFLHAHENGNGAEDVDDGGHDDERAEDFYKVDATEHDVLYWLGTTICTESEIRWYEVSLCIIFRAKLEIIAQFVAH